MESTVRNGRGNAMMLQQFEGKWMRGKGIGTDEKEGGRVEVRIAGPVMSLDMHNERVN